MLKFRSILLPVLLIASFQLGAQQISRQVFSNLGAEFNSGDYHISMTLGEAIGAKSTSETPSIMFNSGYQQGNVFFISHLDPKPQSTEISFNIYPNPARDYISIELQKERPTKWEIQVFDLYGKEIPFPDQPREFLTNNGQLNLGKLAKGTYLLRIIIFDDKTTTHTYKILKT